MFSFEGDFKSKRQISLGGRRQAPGERQDLLRQAQQERQQREDERRRWHAAIIIQSFYRSSRKGRLVRDRQRLEWDNCFRGGPENVEALARRLLFFYRPLVDGERLDRLLESAIQVDITKLSFSNRLLRTAVGRIQGGTEASCNFLSSILRQTRSGADLDLHSQTFDTLCNLRIIKELCSPTVLPSINHAKLLIAIVNQADSITSVFSDLLKYLLAKPRIKTLANYHILESEIDLSHLINGLHSVVGDLERLSSDERLNILCNLINLSVLRCGQWSVDIVGKRSYVYLIQLLFADAPRRLMKWSNQHSDHMDDDEEDDDAASRNSLTIAAAQQRPSESADKQFTDEEIYECLLQLCDQEVLRLFTKLLFHYFKTPQIDAAARGNIMQLVGVLSTIYLIIPSAKTPILGALMFTPAGVNIYRWLWQLLAETELLSIADQRGKLPANRLMETALAPQWYALVTFTEMISRLLLTCGNEEFYETKENAVGLPLFISFSAYWRNIAFVLFMSIQTYPDEMNIPGTLLSFGHVRRIASNLLQQLHLRDSMRQYCPDGHWDMSTAAGGVRPYLNAILESPTKMDQVETVSPYLAILDNVPFLVPFEDRVRILRHRITIDKEMSVTLQRETVPIRRPFVMEDGFAKLNPLGAKMKSAIRILLISELGMEEAGIDGGGVFKEFLTELSRKAFDPNMGLFRSTHENLIYPNPQRYAQELQQLQYFEFLGRILAKALYEGILLDFSFAPFFLSKWLGRLSYLDYLPSLDPDLYKNLMFLKNYDGDVEDLSLNFTVVDEENRVVELIKNGKDIAVTAQNRIRYIYLVANYKLNVQIAPQSAAFMRGLSDLIDINWLKTFNENELYTLVSGIDRPIDIEDLKRNVNYGSVYTADHTTIKMLWNVLESFSNEDRRRFVKFVTSCPRPPLLGFKELQPKFSISAAGPDLERLPTASTCVNLLKLPIYKDQRVLAAKLRYAINSSAGFELS